MSSLSQKGVPAGSVKGTISRISDRERKKIRGRMTLREKTTPEEEAKGKIHLRAGYFESASFHRQTSTPASGGEHGMFYD